MKKKTRFCYLNPDIFVAFSNNQCILYNYKAHQEYVLNKEHLKRIEEISRHPIFEDTPIDKGLLAIDVISLKPFKTQNWFWDNISRIFHFGTKDDKPLKTISKKDHQKGYYEYSKDLWKQSPPSIMPENIASYPVIALPQSKHQSMPYWELFKSRKTSRSFNKKAISLSELSTLLCSTFGAFKNEDEVEMGEYALSKTDRFKRTSPSGGGMHPTIPYVVALRVKGLNPGCYFYDSINYELRLIKEIDLTQNLDYYLADQYWANDLSAGIFYVSKLDRRAFKYHNSRAYRVLLLDIGHLSQTFQLVGASMNLGTWLTGHLRDSLVEELLNLDTYKEQVMFFSGIGKGDRKMLPLEYREFIQKQDQLDNK